MNINQSFINNLIELRKRLLFIFIGFLIIFLSLLHFSNDIYRIISLPLNYYLPKNSKLIATDITSVFFVPIKLTVIVAIFLSLPNTIYQLYLFLAPALYKNEKKLALSIIFSVIILFLIGISFCYLVVLPVLLNFISQYKATEIIIMTDISKYLDLVLNLFLVFGLCFQIPVIIILLIYFDIVSIKRLITIRPYIFVGSFIIAAILTPPDIFSQTLLAIPLYILFELGILVSKLLKKL